MPLCVCLKMSDDEGRTTGFAVWNQPGNDITGMVARSEKVAGTCEKVRLCALNQSNKIKSILFIPSIR